ncbi:MAG: cytidine deaminase [Bacteroidota bacterium]|nr:cytidine deaminase [Bacteroidota bacterium]
MKKTELITTLYQYDSITELEEEYRGLVEHSKEAVENAYAPYSKFKVGAAVLLENGEIVKGSNQENAAFPSGMCAERVAMFYANSQFPEVPVKAIAVSAYSNDSFTEDPVPPCGACRQVLLESETRFEQPIKVFLVSKDKITMTENVKALLPINFDDHFLQ